VYRGVMYGVCGSNFYSISSDFVKTLLGSITTSTGFVRIVGNNSANGQLLIVDGQKGYLYDVTLGTFIQITAAGFPSRPIDCGFFEGYFLVCQGQGITVSYSALNDGNLWDPFSFFSVNTGQGTLIGIGIIKSRMFLFKTNTAEAWYNLGNNPDLPFAQDGNLIFDSGCLATWSIQYDFGYLLWLSQDKSGVSSILMTTGQEVQVISTPAIDTQIRNFTNPSDVQSYIYKDDGHLFYVSSWTTDDFTFVADITTTMWHRMEMLPTKFDPSIPFSGKVRHLSSAHAYFKDVHYVGSYKSPILYSMSLDYGTNDGEQIRRERIVQYFTSPTYKWIQIDTIQIDFRNSPISVFPSADQLLITEIDESIITEDGDDIIDEEIGDTSGFKQQFPMAYISVSKNSGESFTNQRAAPLGKIGEYGKRSIWRLFGVQRDFVFKIAIYSDSPKIFMLGGAIQYEELDS
ncbi:MAG TPA: hypothetical protein VKR58_03295, partial [Aquella sp.]|nr:hypothetical protein [Aquella sp.]